MQENSILLDIVSRIRDRNLSPDSDYIPTSDNIYKKVLGSLVESEQQMHRYLDILKESHYIFTIRLVEPDERLSVSGIDAFLAAERSVVDHIKDRAYREIETIFEQEYFQRKQASVIARELLMEVRKYNNTPLGRHLNLTIMIQQLDRILTSQFGEFTETWRQEKLQSLLRRAGLGELVPGQAPAEEHFEDTAAVSTRVTELEKMDLSGGWGRAVSKFSVDLLIRVHVRKREFDTLSKLIRSRKIAREQDLRKIRELLSMDFGDEKIGDGFPGKRHLNDLKKVLSARLNEIQAVKALV